MKTVFTLAAAAAIVLATPATAADLGGDCCADLEERVAELEATAARKGNRVTSLTVYGRVSEAIVWSDVLDRSDWSVGTNSNSGTFIGFSGAAPLGQGWNAGFTVEVAFDGYEPSVNGYGHLGGDTHGIGTNRASLHLHSQKYGKITVGKDSQATDGISQIDLSQSHIASTPLSFRPLLGDGVGEALEMDGTRTNLVRYDSPVLAGFVLSGSVAANGSEENVYDVALRYAGEFGQIAVAAGIGYRDGISVQDGAIGIPLILSDDVEAWSGSASVMHKPTGFFMNGTVGQMDVAGFDVDGWAIKVGLEKGGLVGSTKDAYELSNRKTTFFAEYGEWNADYLDVSYFGGGIVHSHGPASFYLSGRQYDLGVGGHSEDATVVMAGMKLDF